MATFKKDDAFTPSYFRTLFKDYKKQDIDCYALHLIKAIIDMSNDATPGFIIDSIKSITEALKERIEAEDKKEHFNSRRVQ